VIITCNEGRSQRTSAFSPTRPGRGNGQLVQVPKGGCPPPLASGWHNVVHVCVESYRQAWLVAGVSELLEVAAVPGYIRPLRDGRAGGTCPIFSPTRYVTSGFVTTVPRPAWMASSEGRRPLAYFDSTFAIGSSPLSRATTASAQAVSSA
jgi:hypothetical protein